MGELGWIASGIIAFLIALAVIGNDSIGGQLPNPSLLRTVATAEKEGKLAEKRKTLTIKCQQVLGSLPLSKMSLKQRKQMAALASKADSSLMGAGNALGGAPVVNPTQVVEQMLDDAEFFIGEIERCSEATKKGKSCTLSTDAQAVLRSFTERGMSQSLKELPSYCDVAEFAPNQPEWVPISGNIRPGIKVYLGYGPKTYWAEIVDIDDHHKMRLPDGTVKEFRGVQVRFPNGSVEWKTLDMVIGCGCFFIKADDPARKP